eukprot:gene18273-34989_t
MSSWYASEASAGWNNLSGPTSFFTAAACCFGLTWSMWRRSRTWSHYWLLAALVSIGVMSAQLHDREWAIKAGRNLKHPMGVVYATSAVLLCSIACDPARFIGRVQKLKKSWGDCFKAQAPHRAPTSSSTADDDVQLMGLDHEQGGSASTGESEASTSKRWAAIAGYLLLCAPIVIVSAILLHRSHDGVGMESIIGFVLPLCIEFARRRTRYKADQMLEDDEQKYDQIWVDHYEQEASEEATAAVDDLKRIRKQNVVDDLRRIRNITGQGRQRQKIKDLGVLFAQAAALNAAFQNKVNEWATDQPLKCVSVKKRARAIEKLYRSYNSDPGLLIDLVRSSITVDSIKELYECLDRIKADVDVAVLQIKNRFKEDAVTSGGYRNVALSLVLVTDATIRLGMESHICELQFGLKEMEKVKSIDGHKRYVKWRNAISE